MDRFERIAMVASREARIARRILAMSSDDFSEYLVKEISRWKRFFEVTGYRSKGGGRIVADLAGPLHDDMKLALVVEPNDRFEDGAPERTKVVVEATLIDGGRASKREKFEGYGVIPGVGIGIARNISLNFINKNGRQSVSDALGLVSARPSSIRFPKPIGKVSYAPTWKNFFWEFWNKASKSEYGMMSWYQVTVEASTRALPGATAELKTRMGFAGGHHVQEVQSRVRLGRNPVATLEKFVNQEVPRIIEGYIKQNFDRIVEGDKSLSDSLAEYYRTHDYTGD